MNLTIPFRLTVGATYQASKWQVCSLLIDESEMRNLFEHLGSFTIIPISGLIELGQLNLTHEDFLAVYSKYLSVLKRGEIPSDNRFRFFFSSVFTVDINALYAVKVNDTHCMVKICRPVIQLQAHRFDYSAADGKFRSMVFGYDSIHWGLQFSYPHLFQDDHFEVHTVRENEQFPNTALFKKLRRWVRSNTLATPFEIEGKKVNTPIRLGKECFSWINRHPQLKAKRLHISNQL